MREIHGTLGNLLNGFGAGLFSQSQLQNMQMQHNPLLQLQLQQQLQNVASPYGNIRDWQQLFKDPQFHPVWGGYHIPPNVERDVQQMHDLLAPRESQQARFLREAWEEVERMCPTTPD